MFYDVEKNFTNRSHLFESLKNDSEKSLYDSCTTFTKLSAVLKLYNLKVENGWSYESFTALLKLLKEMLPEDNKLVHMMLRRSYLSWV